MKHIEGLQEKRAHGEKYSIIFNAPGTTHVGLTATPIETEEASNTDYFGKPLYTYSLKQGIDDGFLAPYKVIRVGIDVDLEGYRPEKEN